MRRASALGLTLLLAFSATFGHAQNAFLSKLSPTKLLPFKLFSGGQDAQQQPDLTPIDDGFITENEFTADRAGSNLGPSASPGVVTTAPQQSAQADTAQLLSQIRDIGVTDPQSQQQLLNDLLQTDPRFWQPLLDQHRAAIAFRQQQARNATSTTGIAPTAYTAPSIYSQPQSPVTTPASYQSQFATPPVQPGVPASPVATNQYMATRPAPTQQMIAPASGQMQHAPSMSAPPTMQPASILAGQPAAPPQHTQQQTTPTSDAAFAAPPAESPTASSYPADPTTVAMANSISPSNMLVTPQTAADWNQQLASTISALENESKTASPDPTRAARLRLLYLVADRIEDALRPVDGATAAEQEFWSQQLYGLSFCLQQPTDGEQAKTAAEAAHRLEQARASLAEMADLHVHNLAFCTEVSSFGVFTEFEETKFKPGQKVLLYAEIENFISEATPEGYHTALRSRYQVLDAQGHVIGEKEFPLTEEVCRNRRRDFFIRYFLDLPAEQVYDGQRYTLRLTVEDTLGVKVGESTIDFTIDRG